ncbi:hypothetical protein N332_05085, partial [Mesitornis unicolor]
LSSLPSSLVPRALQGGKPISPAGAKHVDLVCCSWCVFILRESDSATALKVTPEGCDEKLGHGHKEMLSPQPAAGKGPSTLLSTPPPLTDRTPSGCFSNRIN